MSVTYLSREALGLPYVGAIHDARHIRKGYPHPKPHSAFTRINVHHTVVAMIDYDHDKLIMDDTDDMERYMRALMTMRQGDLGPEIPYSFIVFESADPSHSYVAEGRGFGRTGAHTQGENSSSYGVSLAGNFSIRNPTPGMLDGIRWVGSRLHDPARARKTLGHRDHKFTECPGNHMYSLLPHVQPPFASASIPVLGPLGVDVPRPTDVTGSLDIPAELGNGTWHLQYDGGIITEGDAPFLGSYPGLPAEARADDDNYRGFYVIRPHARFGYKITSTDRGTYHFAHPGYPH